MNNKIKGAAAAAAAGVLLLGGYGTLAQWSDEAVLNGGSVNAGQLMLSEATAGVWTDVGGTLPVTIPSIADYKVVPGDELTYETSAKVNASGANLSATLAADASTVTGDPELLAAMDVATSVTIGGQPVVAISEANDGQDVAVKVTFTFDANANGTTQLKSLHLANFELALTQN